MHRQVRILLLEDEFITLNALGSSLRRMGYAISGDAMTAEEALIILEQGTTDIAILDIHLNRGPSGIWLAQQIRERFHIPFIFLTAFGDKRTIAEAADTRPAGYLVKPFSPPDLQAAIELAMHAQPGKISASASVNSTLSTQDSIFVKNQEVFCRIEVGDISIIQSFRNYLEITAGGKRYVLRSTLKDFIARLPRQHFLQTHRSYAVNLKRIERVGGNFLVVAGQEIPLSKIKRDELMDHLNFFS